MERKTNNMWGRTADRTPHIVLPFPLASDYRNLLSWRDGWRDEPQHLGASVLRPRLGRTDRSRGLCGSYLTHFLTLILVFWPLLSVVLLVSAFLSCCSQQQLNARLIISPGLRNVLPFHPFTFPLPIITASRIILLLQVTYDGCGV